jgi:peptidoglycan/xylan/chitin deacetylase (PgdA/CDA1 family)/glycosyltransferase involved in cell wall biosynthesis
MMHVSIVVPTHNRRKRLSRTLELLDLQDFPRSEYEVIVVDDGSTDDTWAYLEAKTSVRRFRQTNRGSAGARNLGLLHTTGEIVLMLDDDLDAGENLIAAHWKRHQSGSRKTVVVGALQAASDAEHTSTSRVETWLEHLQAATEQNPNDFTTVRFAPNCSAKRDFLVELGGYDEAFAYAHEDIELGVRLLHAGAHFVFAQEALMLHDFTRSNRDLLTREAILGGRAEVALCRKHPAYRPASQFARVRASIGKQLLWRAPVSMTACFNALHLLCRKVNLDSTAQRWFDRAVQLNFVRGAISASGGWQLFYREYLLTLPVLMYHNVAPLGPSQFPSLTVSPETFSTQMLHLKRAGYVPITVDQWIGWCTRGTQLPERPVLITFDDAYQSLIRHAFPVLNSLGFTATVFVPTGFVGGTNEWDRPFGVETLHLLTAEDIEVWSRRGITFEAHTFSHPKLTTLSDENLEHELQACREDIKSLVGKEPISLAYPWGDVDARVAGLAARYFSAAFTTDEGLNALSTDPLRLRRAIVLPTDTLLDFVFRLGWGHSPLHTYRSKVRLRTRLRALIGRNSPAATKEGRR